MTLNVDLEEVPFAILEAVKARILANRRRLQQGQQQGPKPSLRPRPQRPRIGASSKSWRMPKEAAVVFEDGSALLHLRMSSSAVATGTSYMTRYGEVTTGIAFSFRSFPGLYYNQGGAENFATTSMQTVIRPSNVGSDTINLIQPSNPGGFPSYGNDGEGTIINYFQADEQRFNTIILPAGGKSCVVISLLGHWWNTVNMAATRRPGTNPPLQSTSFASPYQVKSINSITSTSNAVVSNKVYFCTDTFIKEIEIPQKLQDIIDIINPSPASGSGVADGSQLNFSSDNDSRFYFTFNYSYLPTVTDFIDESNLRVGLFGGNTPSIFAELNRIAQFTAPSNIRAFPASARWIAADTDQGWWQKAIEDKPEEGGATAFYSQWSIPGQKPYQDPDVGEWIPHPDVTFTGPPDFLPSSTQSNLQLVWDWDDPDYCRRMCLALGFRPADLEP